MYIFPCSLPDPTKCQPPPKFVGLALNMPNFNKILDYSNHKKPLILGALSPGPLEFDKFGTLKITQNLQKNEVRDVYSDFLDYSTRVNFSTIGETTNYKVVRMTGIPSTCTMA